MMKRYLAAIAICLPTMASAVTLNPESITGYAPAFSSTFPANGYPNQALVGDSYRHVIVFDLSSITGQILDAKLDVKAGFGTHVTVGYSRTYSVWDVTSPINDIARRIQGGPAQSYYDDIGSGKLYGSTTVAVQNTNGANPLPSPAVSVDLVGGLSDLNVAVGTKIALGGKSPQTFWMFNGASDLSAITLTLDTAPVVVPLPAGALLLLTGIGSIFLVARNGNPVSGRAR